MHWLATSLLGAMLMPLLTSAAYQATRPWLHWVRTFAESGAVGATAAFSPSAPAADPSLGHHSEEQGPHRRPVWG